MPLLTDEVAGQLKEEFAASSIRSGWPCSRRRSPTRSPSRSKRLVEELATVDSPSPPRAQPRARQGKVEALGIRRSPAIAIMGADKDHGIRMYGLPSGLRVRHPRGAILDVSSGDSGLSDPTRAALKEIAKPVHIQVFSTPT